ncbi:ATP-binding cassette domain-containing protein [Treponema bryantii]|uniref:ATP-binding cassette domain-containing protein n=1 Tax=Treponema bryantii TaxID=163 RepID=UPI0003B49056|nr:ATP-binding cassette domain-containing protein [Treponema bryantii]
MCKSLITLQNCRIENNREVLVPDLSWKMNEGEVWLVIGPNGGGKADFLNALAGGAGGERITPNADGLFSDIFSDSTELVSLERAARLIQEERENDESDYLEGGVDHGRTGRIFIAQALSGGSTDVKKGMSHSELPAAARQLEGDPAIKLCGIEKILDRGLKYMSTGEIRRTLLARALVSGKKLLILSDPFAGLDIQSRTILLDFFDSIAKRSGGKQSGSAQPHIILGLERWHEVPDAVTHVLEFSDKKVSFCGPRSEYEKLISERAAAAKAGEEKEKSDFKEGFKELTQAGGFDTPASQALNHQTESRWLSRPEAVSKPPLEDILVEMHDVNVGWDGHQVLSHLNWSLRRGQHWLVRGPNGSGKTTFLELITGDNMQVFANDVRIFGNRRGSGETIWDIKKRLGIVSYRLHVEYRMLGGTSLLAVIISGFRDSIGLYDQPTDSEIDAAKKWLALGGFAGRESENFGNLSYGEQRAILILRSAVKTPEILILDEPCHGLDEQYRAKILQLMELIGNGGTTTMLHVTHDPSEVLPCEKHILELHPNEEPMYRIIVN